MHPLDHLVMLVLLCVVVPVCWLRLLPAISCVRPSIWTPPCSAHYALPFLLPLLLVGSLTLLPNARVAVASVVVVVVVRSSWSVGRSVGSGGRYGRQVRALVENC